MNRDVFVIGQATVENQDLIFPAFSAITCAPSADYRQSYMTVTAFIMFLASFTPNEIGLCLG